MGKVLKAVAVIAVMAAIAYFAPQLAPSLLAALGTTATAAATAAATAFITAGLTMAAGAAFALLAGRPSTQTARGLQRSQGQHQERDGFGWKYPFPPSTLSMPSVQPSWWRENMFWPWQRFAIARTSGDCMVPVMSGKTRWFIADRCDVIRAGDLMVFRPNDLRAYMRSTGKPLLQRWWSDGLVKRFVGLDEDRRVAIYETTNPPNRMESGVDRLIYAYRVVSHHRSWMSAQRERWRLERRARQPASD